MKFAKLSGDDSSLMSCLFIASGLLMFFSPFPVLSTLYLFILFALLVFPFPKFYRYMLTVWVIVGFAYFSVAGSVQNFTWLSKFPIGNYGELAKNMLAGHLYLPQVPDEKLLALPNPYPPEFHMKVPFIWDISFFEGKFYPYFGSAPVVTFILPVKIITGKYPSEEFIGFYFTCWAMLFGSLFTIELLESIQKRNSTPLQKALASLAFVFAVPFGALLRRPYIYELALVSGCAYSTLSLYLGMLIYRAREYRQSLRWIALGCGIAYGLAIASRPPLGLIALVLLVMFLRSKIPIKRPVIYFFILGLAPVLDWVLLYNFLRFHNPFEFGLKYQLNHLPAHWDFNGKDLFVGITRFFFQWPKFEDFFPYINMEPYGSSWLAIRHRFMNDGMIGLVFSAPVVLFLVWDRRKIFWDRDSLLLFAMIFVGIALTAANAVAGINVRYESEIFPLFVVGGTAWALSTLGRFGHRVRTTLILLCVLVSVQLSFFASMPLEMNSFRWAHQAWIDYLAMAIGDSGPSFHPIGVEYSNFQMITKLYLEDECYMAAAPTTQFVNASLAP